MRKWSDVRSNIQTLTDIEKEEIRLAAELVAKVIERRTELGWTQRKLAEESGVKQSAIARFESLAVVPRINTLYRLLKPLGLKIKLLT
jgi:transcriptional regulator with XRE-family HTH domain